MVSTLIHADGETDGHDEANGRFLLLKAANTSINLEQQHYMAYYLSVPILLIINSNQATGNRKFSGCTANILISLHKSS